jgi:hypothetical protein
MAYQTSLRDRLANPRQRLPTDHARALDHLLRDHRDDLACRGPADVDRAAAPPPAVPHPAPRIGVTLRHPWPDLSDDHAGFRWLQTDLHGVPGAMWHQGTDGLRIAGQPEVGGTPQTGSGAVAMAVFRLDPAERPRLPGPRMRSAPMAVLAGRIGRLEGTDARLWLRQTVIEIEATAGGPGIVVIGMATEDQPLPLTGTFDLPGQIALPPVIAAPAPGRPVYALLECGVLFRATTCGPQLGCPAGDDVLTLAFFPWNPTPAP